MYWLQLVLKNADEFALVFSSSFAAFSGVLWLHLPRLYVSVVVRFVWVQKRWLPVGDGVTYGDVRR